MKRNKLARLAALLPLCLAAPLFAAGSDALIEAAEAGNAAAVKALLNAGVDANARHNGFTALMKAAQNGHAETVWVLVSAGAT